MIAVGQGRPDHLRHGVGQGAEHAIAIRHRCRVEPLLGDHVAIAAAPFQFHHHLPRQQRQPLALQRGQVIARHGVDDAERTQRLAIAANQRRTGIEADMRRAGDQRIVDEARILGRVGHDEDIVAQHGKGAEGYVTRRLLRIQPDPRQKALPYILDNADKRDRRPA